MKKVEKRLIGLLCCIIPFSAMNILMFNVALSDIISSFRITPATASWVVTIFAIIYAIGSLLYGKLVDRFSFRAIITFGIITFALGSVIGFWATTYRMLLLARIIQAIGASSIPALSILIPAYFVNAKRRGEAMGMVSATLALSGALGPIVGGLISGYLHWRYMFLFPLFTLIALPFFYQWLPLRTMNKQQKVDGFGAILLAITITCLMLIITQFNHWLLIGSIAFFSLFLIQQRTIDHPFIPPLLFKNIRYRRGLLIGSLSAFMNFGITIVTPLLLGQAYGYPADIIGWLLFPGTITTALLGRVGGKMADRKGNQFTLLIALVLLILGLTLLATFAGLPAWIIACSFIFTSVGYSFLQTSLANYMSTTLPKEHLGVGMGVYSLNNFLSVALSGAIVTTLLDLLPTTPIHPLAPSGQSAPYSSVYVGLLLTAIIILILVQVLIQSKKPTTD